MKTSAQHRSGVSSCNAASGEARTHRGGLGAEAKHNPLGIADGYTQRKHSACFANTTRAPFAHPEPAVRQNNTRGTHTKCS